MNNYVPEGWSASNLGELCIFSGGSAFKEKYQGNNYGDYPFIKVSDMNLEGNQRFITKSMNWINEKVKTEAKIKIFPASSVVFAKVGAALLLNRRRILVRDTAIDNNMMSATPYNEDNYFLFYLLQNVDLGEIVQSGAVPSVNQSQMEDIPVLIPPLPEQKKIAAILTSVDTVIEKTQAQIDKLKDLKTGMMQELLTKGIGHTEFKDSPVGRIPVEWEVKDLGDLAFKIEGGGTPPRKNPDYWGKGYPWATVKDLKSIRLSSTEESITKTGLINSSSKLVPAGTVILATRMAVGKAVVFDCDVTINQDLKAFYPKEKLNNKFLLQWYLYKSKYIASLGTGSTVKGIRVDDLKLLTIAVPPYDEQIIIANKIEGIEVLLNHKIAKIQKMTSLKKALMQDLLTGKVRVKV